MAEESPSALTIEQSSRQVPCVEPERLVGKYNAFVERSAATLVADKDIADDIAQGARVRLWEWASERPEQPCFTNFVRRSVRSAAISELRNRRRCLCPGSDFVERLQDHHGEFLAVDGPGEDVLARHMVCRWLMTLPLQLRAVYIGIYVRDLSQREVARQMRISQPRVAQLHDELLRLGRARFAALSVAA